MARAPATASETETPTIPPTNTTSIPRSSTSWTARRTPLCHRLALKKRLTFRPIDIIKPFS
jgi:hypothetical protein